MPLRLSWLLVSIALGAAAASAGAADLAPPDFAVTLHPGGGFKSDKPVQGSLQPFIAALRSPLFRAREQATQVLLHLGTDRLSELQEALARETDPEAATRMTQVAAHLFLKQMTPLEGHAALLGIKLNLELVHPDVEKPDALRMSVLVAELQPGYPAAQDLQVGDRLLAMDGKPFPIDMAIDDFRSHVTSRPPGSIVSFTLIRGGRQMDVDVQLAGLPETAGALPGTVNMIPIETAINMRNSALANFLESLKTGVKTEPLVLADNSPPDAQLNGGIEFNGNGGAIINNGGFIIINGGALNGGNWVPANPIPIQIAPPPPPGPGQ